METMDQLVELCFVMGSLGQERLLFGKIRKPTCTQTTAYLAIAP